MPEGANPTKPDPGTAIPVPTKAAPRGTVLVGIGLVSVSFAAFALQDAIVK